MRLSASWLCQVCGQILPEPKAHENCPAAIGNFILLVQGVAHSTHTGQFLPDILTKVDETPYNISNQH